MTKQLYDTEVPRLLGHEKKILELFHERLGRNIVVYSVSTLLIYYGVMKNSKQVDTPTGQEGKRQNTDLSTKEERTTMTQ